MTIECLITLKLVLLEEAHRADEAEGIVVDDEDPVLWRALLLEQHLKAVILSTFVQIFFFWRNEMIFWLTIARLLFHLAIEALD